MTSRPQHPTLAGIACALFALLALCARSRASADAGAASAGTATTPAASSAAAEQADKLFREGKAQLAQGDFTHACPLFAQSFEADPATGTLLALAICHERAGKLASAFREYNDVAARSKRAGRVDREQAAAERAAALEPKLSKLTVQLTDVPPQAQAVVVQLDGQRLDAARLGTAFPVDGGVHHLEARLGDGNPFRQDITLADTADMKTAVVPVLAPKPAPDPAPFVVAATPAPVKVLRAAPRAEPRANTSSLSNLQRAGLVTLAGSVVSFGVGAVFGIVAGNRNKASEAGCDGDFCTAAAREKRLSAVSAGNVSTAAFLVGGAMATVGIVLFLTPNHANDADYSLAPWASPHAAGADLHGAF